MSRYVSDLSTYNRHHKDGLQLITITQRIYGGERHVVLTELGREVALKIAAAIRDPKPVRKKPARTAPAKP